MAYAMTDEQVAEVQVILKKLPPIDKHTELDKLDVWINDNLSIEEIRLLCMFYECSAANITTTIKSYRLWNKAGLCDEKKR